jgi:hypothetical protein
MHRRLSSGGPSEPILGTIHAFHLFIIADFIATRPTDTSFGTKIESLYLDEPAKRAS